MFCCVSDTTREEVGENDEGEDDDGSDTQQNNTEQLSEEETGAVTGALPGNSISEQHSTTSVGKKRNINRGIFQNFERLYNDNNASRFETEHFE